MRNALPAAFVVALLVLAACDTAVPSSSTDTLGADATLAAHMRPATAGADGLAAVRRATARYQRVDQALADGYGTVARSGCVEHPVDPETFGAMGDHYINLDRLLDGGALDPAAPEVVLYEPQKNGRLRLVAVEYIVPFSVEPRPADGGTAPELLGQTFHPSEPAGGWALHAWVWKDNPTGMFKDWNPRVTCEHAQ